MKRCDDPPELITNLTVRDYFYDSVSTAAANQKQSFTAETVFYITNLLTQFSQSDRLFELTEEGYDIKPLALLYSDAINAETLGEKTASLKYLGDVALFISGLYASSLNRSLVDVDYYVGMGENAYAYLADGNLQLVRELSFQLIYSELACKFIAVVEILHEVADQMGGEKEDDILRLYENWLSTDSAYAAAKLREHNIIPLATNKFRKH